MKNVVNFHDVFPYIYTGMYAKDLQNYKYQGFPMGGIKFLMRHIGASASGGKDMAFFFDEGRSFRKDLWPGYKGSRKDNKVVDILAQTEIIKELLQSCNFKCYSAKTLEADDLIYSACEQNRDKYLSLNVHTADYDLAHNVDSKTKFVAVNSKVNNLTVGTFSTSIISGESIPLNTISAHKVFFGCTSDEVKSFSSEAKINNHELFQGFVKFLEKNSKDGIIDIKLSKHPKALSLFVRDHPGLTENDKAELYTKIEVIYPRLHNEIIYEANSFDSLGDQGTWNLAKLFTMCGEPDYVRKLGLSKLPLISDQDKAYFSKKASDLATGEFAVDRGLNLESSVKSSELHLSGEFDW